MRRCMPRRDPCAFHNNADNQYYVRLERSDQQVLLVHRDTCQDMARYRDIADDLRRRLVAGEFPVGSPIPSDLQAYYEVPGLNTIRRAQRLLVDEGLLETQQGVGVFVISHTPQPPAVNMLAELKGARLALDRAIAHLERADE